MSKVVRGTSPRLSVLRLSVLSWALTGKLSGPIITKCCDAKGMPGSLLSDRMLLPLSLLTLASICTGSNAAPFRQLA